MIPRQALFGKLDLTNVPAIETATSFAKLRGNFCVELARWIYPLLQFDDGDLQLSLVREIQILRTALSRHVDVERVALSAALIAIETRLKLPQNDVPLVLPHVDERVVEAIVADRTRIPAGRMAMDEATALIALQAKPERRLVGQNRTPGTIIEHVRTARAPLTDPAEPIVAFLMAGPAGIGKAETALAEAMYGDEQSLVTFDMREFQKPHSASLLGSAPTDDVGDGKSGLSTEAVRCRSHCLSFLNDVEKAHPVVLEKFHQVFGKGCMEDGQDRRVDFRDATVLPRPISRQMFPAAFGSTRGQGRRGRSFAGVTMPARLLPLLVSREGA